MDVTKYIDTHSHLYTVEFDEDRPATIQRAIDSGAGKLFFPNINKESIEPLLKLCNDYPGFCYPMMGLHPSELSGIPFETLSKMKKMLEDPNNPFIAIGEVGLDLYWDDTMREEQIKVFQEQIQWSIQFQLPLMIHVRSAHQLLVDMLAPYKEELPGGVFHCFGGTEQQAKELLEFKNFALGIGGIVTFKRSKLPYVLESVPLDRIVLETDSPFLAPMPKRGNRNECSYIPFIVDKLVDIYGKEPVEIIKETNKTVARIFPKAFK